MLKRQAILTKKVMMEKRKRIRKSHQKIFWKSPHLYVLLLLNIFCIEHALLVFFLLSCVVSSKTATDVFEARDFVSRHCVILVLVLRLTSLIVGLVMQKCQ